MPEVEEVPTLVSGEIKPADDAQTMLTNIEAYLKSIGATDEKSYVPTPEPKATIRELTAEEKAEYEAKKAESDRKMAEWRAKREKEMEAEGGPAWQLVCDLRAAQKEKEAKGLTGPALITSATYYGSEVGYKIS